MPNDLQQLAGEAPGAPPPALWAEDAMASYGMAPQLEAWLLAQDRARLCRLRAAARPEVHPHPHQPEQLAGTGGRRLAAR